MPVADNPNLKPTPDDFLVIIRRQQLGKLKIYLGPCPGVGKTYQMLIEGNRLRQQGVDVVIGYVEPHDRPETSAQIGELEIAPPLVAKYHGITLKEMELDAVLARKPTVALVDELAHTNAPQSRNRKRYEDVQDLLRAGINVIATVNIQHFESLYNIVEDVTGVRVKERVPDEIITQADQVVNIDLPAEDLLERLQAGKIYPTERVEAALANFFTAKNLSRLREMTLSETVSARTVVFIDTPNAAPNNSPTIRSRFDVSRPVSRTTSVTNQRVVQRLSVRNSTVSNAYFGSSAVETAAQRPTLGENTVAPSM
jgi:two-component system, OmpR family, sensor histidine kinase KdpD